MLQSVSLLSNHLVIFLSILGCPEIFPYIPFLSFQISKKRPISLGKSTANQIIKFGSCKYAEIEVSRFLNGVLFPLFTTVNAFFRRSTLNKSWFAQSTAQMPVYLLKDVSQSPARLTFENKNIIKPAAIRRILFIKTGNIIFEIFNYLNDNLLYFITQSVQCQTAAFLINSTHRLSLVHCEFFTRPTSCNGTIAN